MHSEYASLSRLPALAALHSIDFHDGSVAVRDIPGSQKGAGLFASRDIAGVDNDLVPLMTVPQDCVLSLDNIWLSAKSDPHLREVLNALGDYAKVCEKCHQSFSSSLYPVAFREKSSSCSALPWDAMDSIAEEVSED